MASPLTLAGRARRITGVGTAVLLFVLTMTMIVFANYSIWNVSFVFAVALTIAIYALGTLAFRAQVRGHGRIQLNTMLGNHQVDLRSGFKVKRGVLGPVLRVGRRRYRLNRALSDDASLELWLQAAAAVE